MYKKTAIISVIIILLLNSVLVYANSQILPNITGSSGIVMDLDTKIVLYNKDMHEKYYPASITKIMTALLAIEYIENKSIPNYNERITMSYDAVFSLPYNSSNIAMNDEETLSMDEALHAILLASANEVSNAVAEHISGDTETFSELMTDRALEIGAANTNFTNPHGLHDENHYTTAYDMALIMAECLKYDKFVELINTTYYEIPPTEKQSETRILYNNHKMIRTTSPNYDDRAVGGKTGYTSQAGTTLITYSIDDSKNLICVVLDSEGTSVYQDTASLFDYSFNNYRWINLIEDADYLENIPSIHSLENKNVNSLNVISSGELRLNVPISLLKNNLEYVPIYNPDYFYMYEDGSIYVKESIVLNEKVGFLEIYYNDVLLGTVDLISANIITIAEDEILEPSTLLANIQSVLNTIDVYYLGLLVVGFLLIIVTMLIVSVYCLKQRNRRRKFNARHYRYKYK